LTSKSLNIKPVLQLHQIAPFGIGVSWLKPKRLDNILKFLRQQGYENLPLANLLTQEGIGISFDDGYESLCRYGVEILKSHGFTACIFLVAGFVGRKNLWDVWLGPRPRHLSWNEIFKLKDLGFEFGSHSLTHPDLTRVSGQQLSEEIKGSKECLERHLGSITLFSYPFGRYNARVREVVKAAGYRLAFTSLPPKSGEPIDPFAYPRIPVHLIDSLSSIKRKLSLNPKEYRKDRFINFLSWGTILTKGSSD
jgi:peptidoglycan/xylan/chitin deacetylase (PgdA/CDA1 family)